VKSAIVYSSKQLLATKGKHLSDETPPKPPVINVRGSKVGLGPYLKEHIEIWLSFANDPEQTIYGDGTYTLPSRERELEFYEKLVKDETRVAFTIYELEMLSMIGNVGLRHIDHRHGTATLGIGIGRKEYWGKGYGTEAAQLILEYGFRFLNLHNIDLDTAGFNTRAFRSYQKIGFKEIGRRRDVILMDGKRYDEIRMDMLPSEFEPPIPGWFTI
jgi:RimJ/RimL family protein N-acetyltransferase